MQPSWLGVSWANEDARRIPVRFLVQALAFGNDKLVKKDQETDNLWMQSFKFKVLFHFKFHYCCLSFARNYFKMKTVF